MNIPIMKIVEKYSYYFLSVRKSIIRRMAREQAGQNGA